MERRSLYLAAVVFFSIAPELALNDKESQMLTLILTILAGGLISYLRFGGSHVRRRNGNSSCPLFSLAFYYTLFS